MDDVLDGLITLEQARTVYGVIIREEALDRDATQRERTQRSQGAAR